MSGARVAIVTGASRGIGAATALAAAREGWRVAVVYRVQETRARAVVEEIRAAGGEAAAFQADVSREPDVQALFQRVERELGAPCGLVNNAGISGGFSRLDELEVRTLREVLDVNLVGAFLCAREAVRRMSTKRGGTGGAIVNVSSQVARFGGRQLLHYAASKGALESLTIGLAREVAAEGVRVNAVSPGVIRTDQLADAPETRLAGLRESIPQGRIGEPQEVAETILWLLSERSSYVTGAILPVAGGR